MDELPVDETKALREKLGGQVIYSNPWTLPISNMFGKWEEQTEQLYQKYENCPSSSAYPYNKPNLKVKVKVKTWPTCDNPRAQQATACSCGCTTRMGEPTDFEMEQLVTATGQGAFEFTWRDTGICEDKFAVYRCDDFDANSKTCKPVKLRCCRIWCIECAAFCSEEHGFSLLRFLTGGRRTSSER